MGERLSCQRAASFAKKKAQAVCSLRLERKTDD